MVSAQASGTIVEALIGGVIGGWISMSYFDELSINDNNAINKMSR